MDSKSLDEQLRERGRKKAAYDLENAFKPIYAQMDSTDHRETLQSLKATESKRVNGYYSALKEGEHPTIRSVLEEVQERLLPIVQERAAQAEVNEFIKNVGDFKGQLDALEARVES